MALPTLDDPFYYLANFHTVLAWIDARYRDLLSDDERDFIAAFDDLPRASRALWVRMVMRKGTLFRAGKLNYPEIGPVEPAVAPLVAMGWVDEAPELSLEQLFALSTKAELAAGFASHLAPPGAGARRSTLKKAELFERLQPAFEEPRAFSAWLPESRDRVFALTRMALCDRLRLMFFGNLRQDWSTFVLADLGVHRYERVAFTSASRAFHSRADVDAYLHLQACRERLEAGEPLAALREATPLVPSDNAWIEARRHALLFRLAQAHERAAELATALDLYARCRHPGARIRRLRVLERRGEFETAFALAGEAHRAPESENEGQHLARLLPRLARKLGQAGPPRRRPAPVERIDLTLPRSEGFLSVEESVRQHLSEPCAPVHFVENTLINSLFGLLCWEAIFAPLPGAFFHPFHIGPADLLRPDFRRRREALFEACLARLDDDGYRATIRENFVAKHGIQSPFVHWALLDEALLERALACLPRAHLRLWFERLLYDLPANRAGLPDLIQFRPERDPSEGRYRMIEVKGPGDRLQDNQVRWLEFCADHDMPVAVCYVQWTEVAEPPVDAWAGTEEALR